jgi:hypothetical protein
MADAFGIIGSGGVALTVLPGGWQRDGAVIFSERVIPGGADVYIDIAGKPTNRIVLPLFSTTQGGLDSLRALKGTTAALSYGSASVTLALLVDVRLSDVAPLGETHAEAEWKVITP